MNNYTIELNNISKEFTIPSVHKRELRERLIHFYKFNTNFQKKTFSALKDINIKVKKGEFVSIIGRNGSGKSTLLKLIAGIYNPSNGKIRVNGEVSSFLELGVGFNSELTATENIHLYSAILGFNKKETKARITEIFEFSELTRFQNTMLQSFSNGMQVRLAFSVAIQSNAPILLVDEVLAVGDIDFKKKCYKVFEELKVKGRTILYSSHDMDSVLQFSDRVVYLKQGGLYKCGPPREVVNLYLSEN